MADDVDVCGHATEAHTHSADPNGVGCVLCDCTVTRDFEGYEPVAEPVDVTVEQPG